MIAFNNRFSQQKILPQAHVTRFVEFARELLAAKRDHDARIALGDNDDFVELSGKLVSKLSCSSGQHWPAGMSYPICLIAELAACLTCVHRGLEPMAAIRPILQSLNDSLREKVDKTPVSINERKRQEADFGIIRFCAAELANREAFSV